MKTTLAALTLGLGLIFAAPACFADDDDLYTDKFMQCMSDNGGTNTGIRDCATAEMDTQDRLLNKYYNQLMDKLNDSQRQKLKAGEIAWLKMRQQDTDLIPELAGGAEYAVTDGLLMFLEYTARRVLFLKNLLNMVE